MLIVGTTISGCISHSVISPPAGKRVHAIPHLIGFPFKKSKYQEVVIPFIPTNSLIFVNAIINGKIYPCIVDTGASFTYLPASLNLTSRPCFARNNVFVTYGDNFTRSNGDCRILPAIHLSQYVVHNLKTLQSAHNQLDIASNVMILGNNAFDRVVLTLDYRNRVILVRTHQYDLTKMKHASSDRIIPIEYTKDSLSFSGQVNHHPARFILDSGATNCAFTKAFCQRYGLKQQQGRDVITTLFVRAAHARMIKETNIGISSLYWKATDIDIENDIDAHIDGTLGMPLFKHYRVTIDYFRHKMLLEPYSNYS